MIEEFNHDLGRHDAEVTGPERTCIGYMMNDGKLVPSVRQWVDIVDFYKIKHQRIVDIIYRLVEEGIEPDPVAVITCLREDGDEATLEDEILVMYDSVPESEDGSCEDSAIWYARQVREAAERRRLMKLFYQKHQECLAGGSEIDIDSLVGDTVSQMFDIHRVDTSVSVYSEMGGIMKLLQSGEVFGIPTGFTSLDNITCGYQAGELYVLGGRPAMGKTALAVKLMAMLCQVGIPTLFMSLEMPIRHLLLRTLSILTGLPYRYFRHRGEIPKSAWSDLVISSSEIAGWPLIIDDTAGLTVEQISARVEAHVVKEEVKVVFIDHMHLIPTIAYGQNNAQAYSHISLMLKNVARRLQIPVVCLAQLNRAVEGRPDKRPQLSDLRESGGIEQNADNVWLLYRPEYYEPGHQYNQVEDIELIVAKNKSLETGTLHMQFKGAYMEFVE